MNEVRESGSRPLLGQELLDELLRLDHEVAAGRTTAKLSERSPEVVLAQRALEALEDVFPRSRPWTSEDASGRRETIGGYKICEVLGAGGFAIVYRGMDEETDRSVAIKVPRPQTLLSSDLRERFLIEARAARRLDHRCIVPVLETGEDKGLPYIVYEYCEGPTLAAWLLGHPGQFSSTQAARIVLQLSEAIAYSHHRGVIHRDIKPANVLLFADANKEDQVFPLRPRLTDFGLARLADVPSRQTRSSMMLGTPAYMAPELVAPDARSASGHAVDLYSLGALLYELLTGRPPFVARSPWQVLMMVRDKEPSPPRVVQPLVPRDLETICLKCLSKLPRDRYATAEDLSADLRRFLAGQRIAARRPTRRQLVIRWSRRHPVTSILAVGLSFSLVSLLVGLVVAFQNRASLLEQIHTQNRELVRNVEQLNAAVQSEHAALVEASRHATVANQFRYASDVALAASCLQRHDIRDARRIINATLADPSLQSIREFAVRYLDAKTRTRGRVLSAGRQACWVLRYSPDRQRLLAAGDRSVVQVFETATGQLLDEIETDQIEVNGIAFSPDGSLFATAGDDGTVRLWDFAARSLVRTDTVLPGSQVFAVEFADEGRNLIAAGIAPTLVFLDLESGNREAVAVESADAIEGISMSPDRTRLVIGLRQKGVAVLDVEGRRIEAHLTLGDKRTHAVAFSEDGRWIAASSEDNLVKLWDARSLQEAARIVRPDAVTALAFQDQRLICGDRGGVISVWDLQEQDGVPTALELNTQGLAHAAAVQTIVSVGPQVYYSGSRDRSVKAWNSESGGDSPVHPMPRAAPRALSRFLLARSDRPSHFWRFNRSDLELCDAEKDEVIDVYRHSTGISSIANSDRGVLIGDDEGNLALLDQNDGSIRQIAHAFESSPIDSIYVAPNGQRLFVTNDSEGLAVLSMETGRRLAGDPAIRLISLSPDGRFLAAVQSDSNDIIVIEPETWKEVVRLKKHQGAIYALEFSPDGSRLVSAGRDRQAIAWDTTQWSPTHVFGGHQSAVKCVAISHDSQSIALSTEAGVIKLWHLPTGRALMQLASDLPNPMSLLFTGDSDHLIAFLKTGAIQSYSATPRNHERSFK